MKSLLLNLFYYICINFKTYKMLGQLIKPILKKIPAMLEDIDFEQIYIERNKATKEYKAVVKVENEVSHYTIPEDELSDFFITMLEKSKL